MTDKKILIWIAIAWVLITLINYYYTNFFILGFLWLGVSFFFAFGTINQLIKLIKERKTLTKARIKKTVFFAAFFILTFQREIPNRIIEKVDWKIFETRRENIVQQVIKNQLKPNVEWNGWVCELPFEFPVVSNGGNDIGISRNDENNLVTVSFWVFRNFFDNPSTHFVFTQDPEIIERIENKIKVRPNDNWKIKDKWFRIYGDY